MSAANGQGTRRNDGECRILIVGHSGSGKSTLGNKLLDKPDVQATDEEGNMSQEDQAEAGFTVSGSFDSATKRCQYQTATATMNGRAMTLKVVDTPGLFDPVEPDIRLTLIEVTRSMALCCPGGPHVIIFAVPCGRFTEEKEKSFDAIMKLFEDKVKDHLLVVFTHGEALGGRSIEDELATSKVKGLEKVLRAVGSNYVVCTNDPERRADEKNALLEKIVMISDSCTKHYNSDLFLALTKNIEEEINKLIREKGLSRPRAIQEVRRILIGKEDRKEFWNRLAKEVVCSAFFASFVGIFWGVGFVVVRKVIEGAFKAALKAGASTFVGTFPFHFQRYLSGFQNRNKCIIM